LIAALEERCENLFGVFVSLSEGATPSGFDMVGGLADVIESSFTGKWTWQPACVRYERPCDRSFVSDFNIQNLAGYLSIASEPLLRAVSPVTVRSNCLHDATLCAGRVALTYVVLTAREGASPAFASILNGNKVAAEKLDAEVDDFCGLLIEASLRTDVMLVPTWVIRPYHHGWGLGICIPMAGLFGPLGGPPPAGKADGTTESRASQQINGWKAVRESLQRQALVSRESPIQ
jgi:hypothetical protein